MFFFFKQKTAYEMRISDWVQTCALPISPQHQARKSQAAAEFEGALAGDVVRGHGFGQQAPGGPDVAEQAPLRRRNAQQLCVVVGVRELLQVGERADPVVEATEAQRTGMGVVARHGRSRKDSHPGNRDADAEDGSETATRLSDEARETADNAGHATPSG